MYDEFLTIEAARQTFLDKYDINTNYLEASKFIFVSPTMHNLNFFAQSAVLPSISIDAPRQPTPLSDIFRHGDKIIYEPLTLTFLVDEDLKVWEELYNWAAGNTYPIDQKQYAEQLKKGGPYADMQLIFLKNSYQSNLSFKFWNCHPIFLGTINFSSSSDAESVLTTEVTFRFDTFEIMRGAQ